MPVSLALLLTAGVLIACGVYLFLERTLTRVLLGFVLAGNGVNLLYLVAAGRPGLAPFEGTGDPSEMSDPLPFAMVLTAVVITLGVSAFVLALAYRAWQLFGHDEVPDDVEDRRVLRRRRPRRVSRREAMRTGASHVHAEGTDPEAEDSGDGHVPATGSLSEEHRHGALLLAQDQDAGFGAPPETDAEEEAPEGEDDADRRDDADADPVGADISGEQDAPFDPTESDEDEGEDDEAAPEGPAGGARGNGGTR